MSLVSLSFILFFAGALIVYYCLPIKWRYISLIASSLVFFVIACGASMLPYLIFSVIATYVGAILIHRSKTQKQAKWVFALTIGAVGGLLFILKDTQIFISSYNVLGKYIGSWQPILYKPLMAPIGISYYTLSLISYVTDVYRQVSEPQRHFGKHLLYSCYFPTLTSGPIMQYHELDRALTEGAPYQPAQILSGLQRMLWGYFKKMVIADRLGVITTEVFANDPNYFGAYISFATLCIAFQLYADFSGCMDIVLGASECFGIKLPENFNFPFTARSFPEFWQRWHISLGIWSKNYLFYPLLKSDKMQRLTTICKKRFGKKLGKRIPLWCCLLIMWGILGLWHGGTFKFLFVSGIVPSVLLIGGELLQPLGDAIIRVFKVRVDCFSYRLFQRVRTVFLSTLMWPFILAPSFIDGLKIIYRRLIVFNPWVWVDGSLLKLGLSGADLVLVGFGLLLMLAHCLLKLKGVEIRKEFSKCNLPFRWLVLMGGIFFVLIFGIYGPVYNASAFIYGGF